MSDTAIPSSSPSATLRTLRAIPGIGGLTFAVLLLGFATSFAGPYLSLFGVERAGMKPFELGVFLTLASAGSITISTLVARLSDRLPNRTPILLGAVACAALGYVVLASTTNYVLLCLAAMLFLGAGSSAFPQVFALAKAQAGPAGEQGISALRSMFSLAWVVGPGIGAALLASGGFHGLFLSTAVCFALAALPVLRVGARVARENAARPAAPEAEEASAAPARPVWAVALSLVLYGTSMSMAATALPLHVTRDLHGTSNDVGLLVGLCALLEIPVMWWFVMRPGRASNEKLVLWGFALFALYNAMVVFAPGVAWLALAMAVRAVTVAIVSCLGMAFVQDLMPGRVGVATTLYANTMNAGALLGGLGIGAIAQFLGYREVFVMCVALGAAAWALLLATRRRAKRAAA